MRLDPKEFEQRFRAWVRWVAELTAGEGIHLDGTTPRSSRRGTVPAIHMVSAWATEARLVPGQLKTEAHSNEITATRDLNGQISTEARYFLSSLPADACSVARMISTILPPELSWRQREDAKPEMICDSPNAAPAQAELQLFRGVFYPGSHHI